MSTSLVDRLVPAALWSLVEPLLPPAPRHGRRRTVPDRNCFAALAFMTRTSTPWALLPVQELGCGSQTTAWRRLDEWERAGVFDQLSLVLLDKLGAAGRIDLGRISVDTVSLRALKRGAHTGANPVDRGKAGSKLHLAGDNGVGVPLAVILTAANVPDGTMLQALVDDLPAVRMRHGRRRRRPGRLHADKAYDSRDNRRALRARGISPRIARRGAESSQRLGRVRWKAERTIAWMLGCRRLRLRYERSDARFYAFVLLACSLISFHVLQQPPW